MLQRIYKRYAKRRQFYWWFSSYVLIMALSILINMIGYSVAIDVLEQEVEKNNENAVANLQVVCDNFFRELMSDMYGLLQSSSINQMVRNNISDYERQKYTQNVLDDIRNSLIAQKVDSCGIILNDDAFCIQSGVGVVSLDMAYDIFYQAFFESKDEWLNQVFGVSGSKFIITPSNGKSIYEIEGLVPIVPKGMHAFLVYRIPNINPGMAVVAKVNSAQLVKLLSNAQQGKKQSFIVDENGSVVFRGNDSMELSSLKDVKEGLYRSQGAEYMANVMDSETAPFRYVQMIRRELYLREIRRVRNSSIWGFFLCVLLIGGLSWWFAKLNDRQKRRLDMELAEQRKHIRKNMIQQVLQGRITHMEDIPLWYRELFVGHKLVVLLFEFSPLTVKEQESDDAPINHELLCKYLASLFAEKNGEGSASFCVINEVCVGVLKQDEQKTNLHEIQVMAEAICKEVAKELKMDVRCAISQAVETICDLHKAYEQTIEAMNLCFLGENKIVFLYDDVWQSTLRYEFTSEMGERFVDMLMVGDYQGAEQLIQRQFDFSQSDGRVTLGVLRMVAAEMIRVLLKAAAQIDENGEIDCNPLYMAVMQLSGFQQLNKIRKTILEYAKKLCDMSQKQIPEKTEHRYKKIEEYIRENYMDPKLNVNMLADVFQINRSWLSKAFRESTGISVSDYIIKHRIEKAKELLQTDMTIAQIAEATGFSGAVLYCRVFKKQEGITSQQYRQLIGAKSKEKIEEE